VNRSKYLGLVAACVLTRTAAAQPDTDKGGDAEVDMTGDDKASAPVDADADAAPVPKQPPDDKRTGTVKPSGPLGDSGGHASPFSWEPFGFLRLQYKFVQNDPNVEYIGRDDGFELQNARFGVRGTYEKRVRFVMSIDGAVDERAQQNTPQGKLRVGLRDAYADVLTSGALFVRAGFFQTWADPNRLVADINREFVDRPIESRGVRSTEGYYAPGLPPGRSLGAALRIEPEQAMKPGFELAIQNGADEFSSNNDNDLPSISAAGMLRLDQDGFLVAGARYNPRTVGELPFRQDETDVQGFVGAQVNTGAVRVGAGAIFQKTFFGSTGGPSENVFGAHGQVLFKIPASSPVWVGYRFGILDPSSLILSDRVMEHTAGGVIGVPDLRMRVQLQITHVMEQAARELSNSRVQVAAEVAL